MNWSLKKVAAVVSASACLALPALVRAQDRPDPDSPPLEHIMQFRTVVQVGSEGTGELRATFRTTAAGELVRYVLAVQNGCAPDQAPAAQQINECPPGINSITVMLNGQKVFQKDEGVGDERAAVALKGLDAGLNEIHVTAGGPAGSAARLSIVALRPAVILMGGRSILPWGWVDPLTKCFVTAHNSGPAPMVFRVNFFKPDGTFAGRTEPRLLPPFATAAVELGSAAERLGLDWRAGAVHVQWVSRGWARMSATGTETHREPNAEGVLQVTNARELALDDYGPFPLPREAYDDIAGALGGLN